MLTLMMRTSPASLSSRISHSITTTAALLPYSARLRWRALSWNTVSMIVSRRGLRSTMPRMCGMHLWNTSRRAKIASHRISKDLMITRSTDHTAPQPQPRLLWPISSNPTGSSGPRRRRSSWKTWKERLRCADCWFKWCCSSTTTSSTKSSTSHTASGPLNTSNLETTNPTKNPSFPRSPTSAGLNPKRSPLENPPTTLSPQALLKLCKHLQRDWRSLPSNYSPRRGWNASTSKRWRALLATNPTLWANSHSLWRVFPRLCSWAHRGSTRRSQPWFDPFPSRMRRSQGSTVLTDSLDFLVSSKKMTKNVTPPRPPRSKSNSVELVWFFKNLYLN